MNLYKIISVTNSETKYSFSIFFLLLKNIQNKPETIAEIFVRLSLINLKLSLKLSFKLSLNKYVYIDWENEDTWCKFLNCIMYF